MKKPKKYKITIEDESHLQTIGSASFSPVSFILAALAFLFLAVVAGGMIVAFTPLKTLLPGYLKKSERTASVESLMRLDSLQNVYARNQEYIDNLIRIVEVSDNTDTNFVSSQDVWDISPDSIIAASPAEKVFVKSMQEREKYNLSVLTPLAADGMMFGMPARNAVFAGNSRNERKCSLVMAKDEPVTAVADGTVLAAYYSPLEKGYVVIIQHARGFVSRLSHLMRPIVNTGDAVDIGEVIALPFSSLGKDSQYINVEMWHNAIALKPYDFLANDISYSIDSRNNKNP